MALLSYQKLRCLNPFGVKEALTPEKGKKRGAAVLAEDTPMSTAAWLKQNSDFMVKAENLVAGRLALPRPCGEHTNQQLCTEVLTVMRAGLTGIAGAGQSSSVLLLGPSGSGKSHAVEHCLGRLQESNRSLVVLRAWGGFYSTEVECIRHLAAQAARHLVSEPQPNASFEQCMDWLRTVLRESFAHASAVVIVLDHFENFCSKARQTLLYNLFELAQEAGVPMSTVGTSQKMDVMSCLEKRISSRFTMRHIHASLPRSVEEMVKVLMSKFRLQESEGLPSKFLAEFHCQLDRALRSLVRRHESELEAGQPPSWFLARCLPLARLMDEELAEPLAKKQKQVVMSGSNIPSHVRTLLLKGLSEAEHVLLLAMLRLKDGRHPRTLARALHEVDALHHGSGMMATYNADRYSTAFTQLLECRLLKLSGGGSELPRRYVSCESCVDLVYDDFVEELSLSDPLDRWNPLRHLPLPIQNWSRRRKAGDAK